MRANSRDGVMVAGGPVLEAMESRLFLSATLDLVNGKASYVDSSSDVVTVKLSGGGSGVITFDGETAGGDASSMVVMPASAKSTLTITVKGPDKTTSLHELIVDGSLKSLRAAGVHLEGQAAAEIEDADSPACLTMGVVSGTSIVLGGLSLACVTLTGVSTSPVSLKLGTVSDSVIVAADTPVSLKAARWQGSSIEAAWYKTIHLKQTDPVAGSSIVANRSNARGVSIASLRVDGTFHGDVTAPGAIGSLKAHGLGGGAIAAGSLGKLAITGQKANAKKRIVANSGDVRTEISLSGLNVAAGKKTLGSARIAGTLAETMTVAGNAGTITMAHLRAALTVTGKATVKTRDTVSIFEPGDGAAGALSLGGGSVKGPKVSVKFSVPATFYAIEEAAVATADMFEGIFGNASATYWSRSGLARSTVRESTVIDGGSLTKRFATDGETFFDMTWRGSAAGVTAVTGLSYYYSDSIESDAIHIDMDLAIPSSLGFRQTVKTSGSASGSIEITEGGSRYSIVFAGLASSSLTLVGFEQVTTSQGGTFVAAKVHYDVTIAGSMTYEGTSMGKLTTTVTNTLWLAPELGIVQMKGALSASGAGKETYMMERA